MSRPWLRDERLRLMQVLPVAVLVVAVASWVTLTATGRVPPTFSDSAGPELAADEDIRAAIELDKPSYHQGDLIRYRLRVVWRDAEVRPDREAIENSLSFYPFDKRDALIIEQRPGGGLRELVAEFTLQAVDVAVPATYQLDTATVFYTLASEGHTDVRAVRANPPRVHLGAFLPADVSAVDLRPPKSRIDEREGRRSFLMAGCGIVLTGFAALFLWQRGRRRSDGELSAAEKLWREVDAHRRAAGEGRDDLIACERLFTAALELRAGIPATAFWADEDGIDAEWHAAVTEARGVFAAGYRHEPTTAADIEKAQLLIGAMLDPMVHAERLERERADRFAERLRGQPGVLVGVAGMVIAALAALLLAAMPSVWIASEVRDYNEAVGRLEGDADPQAAFDAFVALSDSASGSRIRAASLYNAGTLLGDFRLMRVSRDQYDNFLRAIFLTDLTLDRLMHDMDLDAEFELVTLLTEMTRRYVQAEDLLKATERVDPDDADARRNLEVFTKIRAAIARSLQGFVQQGEQGDGTEQMLSQTVIDLQLLMETELPDEFAREDEGKDDRDYFILERF